MSFRLLKEALSVEALPPTPKLIYVLLAWKADEHRIAVAGFGWLSRRSGLVEKNVRIRVRQLEMMGWLRTQERGNGRGRCSKYYINSPPKRGTLAVPFPSRVVARKGNETMQIKGNACVTSVLNKRYRHANDEISTSKETLALPTERIL